MPESQGSLAGRHSLSAQGPVLLDVPRPRRAGREQHIPPVLLPSHFYSRLIPVAAAHRDRLEAFEAWKSSCAASFDELAEKGSITYKRFSDTRRLTSSGTRYRAARLHDRVRGPGLARRPRHIEASCGSCR